MQFPAFQQAVFWVEPFASDSIIAILLFCGLWLTRGLLAKMNFANVEANTQIRRFWEAKILYSMFLVINCVPGCVVC